MKLRQLTVALAIAFSSASAMSANFTQTVPVAVGTTFFGQAHTGGPTGAFTDTIRFIGLTGAYNVSLEINSFGRNASQNIDFTSVFLNDKMLDIINVGQSSNGITLIEYLLTGPFTLVVNGTSGANASYSGSINISSVAAVPEPESYALMLAGLSLVGFAARRNKNTA